MWFAGNLSSGTNPRLGWQAKLLCWTLPTSGVGAIPRGILRVFCGKRALPACEMSAAKQPRICATHLLDTMRLAKQLLGSAAAPAALTNPAVQLVAIELMHLLGKLLNASCLQPEDAHVHTFQELACHCGCRGIEFEDGDARALCTGCNVRYVHVSCCAALKRSSMTCSVCARCTWPDVPQDEVAVGVRRIRHELEQTRPFDVMHALVYETMEEARVTLMQGTAENCD